MKPRLLNTVSLSRIAIIAGAMGLILSACVPAQQYNALENDYNQLNQQLSGEINAQQVHITRSQGAIKVAVNSDLPLPVGQLADAVAGGAAHRQDGPDPGPLPAHHDHRDRLYGQRS